MKRYLAFHGEDYYPYGGMEDFVYDFDTLEYAIDAIEMVEENVFQGDHLPWHSTWACVYDSVERKEVWRND